MHRLFVARDVVMLMRLDALLVILRLRFHFLLRDNLLPAVHARGLIEAVRHAERAGLLVGDDNLILESVVAPAVSGVPRGMAHAY